MTFAEELRMEVMYLMLGEKEEKFVSHCAHIFCAHGLQRTGLRVLKMDIKKAIAKIKDMSLADETELRSVRA